MRSPIFVKLLVAALAIIVTTLVAIDSALARYLREQQAAAAASSLLTDGKRIAAALSREPGRPLRDSLAWWCESAGLRLQALDAKGAAVVACAPAAPAPETSTPPSHAVVPLALPNREAVSLRLEAPAPDASTAAIRWRIAAIALAAAALSLLVAYLVSRALVRRVSRLKTYAETLLQGPPPESGIPGPDDELGVLEQSLHRVAAQLRELFERWSLESSRSEAILSSMAEGVLAVDRDLRVVFCNQSVMRAMGVRAPVRERAPVLELMRDSGLVEILRQVVTSGQSVRYNLKVPAADGHAFEVQAAPFDTAGGKGALAIFYDTTDLERLEQVRKDFVANVSHEMRTPLASIVGYADTLLDGALEDPAHNHRFVEIIRTNAIRLNSIASDLLVLSELESGNQPGEPERISVREVLDNALSSVESEARSRQVRIFRGDIDDARVLGYKFRLEQALLNLLVNAVKFNRDGGEVRIEARMGGAQQIRITVSDTGAGIPSQDLPRIFERFYRVDKARSRQVGGTGLGLSIVRHVIERMNGRIEVESQLGKGSTFTVILPAC